MSAPSHTTELWPANVKGWQLSWDPMNSSSVVPSDCAASEVLPSWADQHLLKENLSRTSSSYFRWTHHTVLHTPSTLTSVRFPDYTDDCAHPGLLLLLHTVPLFATSLWWTPIHLLASMTPCSLSWLLPEEPTTPFSRPRLYPGQTSLIALVPPSINLETFWAQQQYLFHFCTPNT